MKQDWTKEPWRVDEKHRQQIIINASSEWAAYTSEANANRIVACVNACAGLSNEDLKLIPEVKAMKKKLQKVYQMFSIGEGGRN